MAQSTLLRDGDRSPAILCQGAAISLRNLIDAALAAPRSTQVAAGLGAALLLALLCRSRSRRGGGRSGGSRVTALVGSKGLTEAILSKEPYGQAHLFANASPEEKSSLIAQLNEIDSKLPGGGLLGYLQRARVLLADSKIGRNPFAGLTPQVPVGQRLTGSSGPGTVEYAKLENLGMGALGSTAFCLVAGGLGERLGYPGIKIGIASEAATGCTFIEYYIRFILALQGHARTATGKVQLELPLAIMTSGDTYNQTVELLKTHCNFGMSDKQIIIMKQEKVPALTDVQARIAAKGGSLETKPHGHGDVHALLHQLGLTQQWASEGRQWLVLFQDTNPLFFRSLCAILGVSIRNDFVMNSVTVPRFPGEAVGGIALLQDKESGSGLTINVEYNQLDPLLKETPAGGDVADASGFSPYPGNINILVFKIPQMASRLASTGGIVPEFVNPKWADSEKSKFKSATRLECMMQDFPRLCKASDKIGFTQLDRLMCFTCVKNNLADAAKKKPPDCALSAEADIYACNAKLLSLAGADVEIEPAGDVSFLGITAKVGARIILPPEFGISLEDMKQRVAGKVRISMRSTLIIVGPAHIDGLELDGAMVLKPNAGQNLKVKNAGAPLEAIPEGELSQCAPSYQIRGYIQDGTFDILPDKVTVQKKGFFSTGSLDPRLTQEVLSKEPYNQSHLFEGASPEEAAGLAQQLSELDEKLPGGGLRGYLERARILLDEAKAGKNPFAGLEPKVPTGTRLTGDQGPGSASYAKLEQLGMSELSKCAFCLVAGGLGERLGFPGIKIGITADVVSGATFIQMYIRFILAFQAHARSVTGDHRLELPLAIMTSGDTYAQTVTLLEEKKRFGMSASQLIIMKQEKVPALMDVQARIAAKKGIVETKPHGHGDVHALLHQMGLAQKWADAGKRWLVLFQDTNPLPFRSLCALLGVSAKEDFVMNSVTVPRIPGEAVGGIALLEDKRKNTSMTINVEYNQLDPLLKATPAGGDTADETGFSPFPGNINILIFKIPEMAKRLGSTGGIVPEFVNPKWADASKSTFKSPTRLECMMQDFPRLCEASDKVGFTQLDRLMCFTCVKNNLEDAAKKNPPDCALSAEADIYACNAQLLRLAGSDVEIESPEDTSFLGVSAKIGARIVLAPEWAISLEQMKERVSGKIRISKKSTLYVEGESNIHGLELDGALALKSTDVSKLKVVNGGAPLTPIPQDQLAGLDPSYQIRGYRQEGTFDVYPPSGYFSSKDTVNVTSSLSEAGVL